MGLPLISVVVPTYNRAHLLGEALDSVFSQSFKDYEVIVIDDGSTDGTEAFVRSRYGDRLRYLKQENRGISGARNRGIELAQGRYIAFLDSDDKWLPEKLEKQAAYMEANPSVGLLSTRLYRYPIVRGEEKREQTEICPPDFPKGFLELLTGKNYVPTTTTMVRRECLEKVGGFDPELKVAEDWDLWLRIARHYGIFCLPDILAEHRDHVQKTTQNLFKVYDGYWRFHEKMMRLFAADLPDFKAYRRRAISFEYLLGAEYLRHNKIRPALRHLWGSVSRDPAIGTYFTKNPKSLVSVILAFLKPYLALLFAMIGRGIELLIPERRQLTKPRPGAERRGNCP